MTGEGVETAGERLRVAMLGTTDGGFIDPDSDVPAGEMYRLAAEVLPDLIADAYAQGGRDALMAAAEAIRVEMRRHDGAQIGFSAIGDAYAEAARIVERTGVDQ